MIFKCFTSNAVLTRAHCYRDSIRTTFSCSPAENQSIALNWTKFRRKLPKCWKQKCSNCAQKGRKPLRVLRCETGLQNRKSAIECFQVTSRPPYWFSQTKFETAAILVYQTSPLGIELYLHTNIVLCFSKPIWLLVTWVKTLYSLDVFQCAGASFKNLREQCARAQAKLFSVKFVYISHRQPKLSIRLSWTWLLLISGVVLQIRIIRVCIATQRFCFKRTKIVYFVKKLTNPDAGL